MSARRVRHWLAGIFAAAAVARALALRLAPPQHPDQFFQYLEPAWARLTGAWIGTWEWIDGVRSWALPGYNGAWMALLRALGLRGPTIAVALQAQWGLVSLLFVLAGWRGGCLVARRLAGLPPQPLPGDAPPGWQGGLLGAALAALFPMLVILSVQTLSELPSAICFVWGFVLAGEAIEAADSDALRLRARRLAAVAGLWLSLSTCLRIQHGPLPLLPFVWMLASRRRAVIVWPLIIGAMGPVVLFGLIDRLTWGHWFWSFINYLDFTFVRHGADRFGTEPPIFYWRRFLDRLPLALPLLGFLALAGGRAAAPFVTAALFLPAILSLQPHKEERFVLMFWPLLLIAAAGTAGGWLAQRAARRAPGADPRRVPLIAAVVAGLLFVVIDGVRGAHDTGFGLTWARFDAQAWVGRQRDATGLLYDEPLYAGGYLWLVRTIPQLQFSLDLLTNPIFSHVLVPRGSWQVSAAQTAGFRPVFYVQDFVVLARTNR